MISLSFRNSATLAAARVTARVAGQAVRESGQNGIVDRLIQLIDQIYDDLNHYFHLLRAGFGDHQRKGDEGVVANQGCAVGLVEDAAAGEEPQEQKCGDALVTVLK